MEIRVNGACVGDFPLDVVLDIGLLVRCVVMVLINVNSTDCRVIQSSKLPNISISINNQENYNPDGPKPPITQLHIHKLHCY